MGNWALQQRVQVGLWNGGGQGQAVFLRNFRGGEGGFLMVGGVGQKGDVLISSSWGRILGLLLGSQGALEVSLLLRGGRTQECRSLLENTWHPARSLLLGDTGSLG